MRENPGSAINRCLTHVNCSFDCSVIVLVGTNLWEHTIHRRNQLKYARVLDCVGLSGIGSVPSILGFFLAFTFSSFRLTSTKRTLLGSHFAISDAFRFTFLRMLGPPPKGNLPSTTHCWKISRFPKQIKTNQNMVISISSIFVTSPGI